MFHLSHLCHRPLHCAHNTYSAKMVAGKNNPQAMARAVSNPRLPPLPRLRVRRPNQGEANPCIGLLSSVLGCWASQGYTAQGCAALEQQLRVCMDAKVSESSQAGHWWEGKLMKGRKRKRRRRAISITNYQDSIHRSRARIRESEHLMPIRVALYEYMHWH